MTVRLVQFTHKEAFKRIDQTRGNARIEHLIYIATSMKSELLHETLSDWEDKHWEEVFPEIYNSKYFEDYDLDYDLENMLYDFNKLGYLAYVYFPECSDIKFDSDGAVTSYSVCEGICRIKYIYSETIENLIEQIEEAAEKFFDEAKKKESEAKK